MHLVVLQIARVPTTRDSKFQTLGIGRPLQALDRQLVGRTIIVARLGQCRRQTRVVEGRLARPLFRVDQDKFVCLGSGPDSVPKARLIA
jgi:hypothetical protein